jgi:hypothetical protein
MHTKKPVADQDIVPDYDFKDAGPNPYAGRYRDDHVPVITGTAPSAEADIGAIAAPKRERGRYAKRLAADVVIDIEPSGRGAASAKSTGSASPSRKA